MKTKLTVTVDEEILPRAKEAARLRGVSLSLVIDGALRELVDGGGPTFSEKWRGKFEPARRRDVRYRRLSRKYL